MERYDEAIQAPSASGEAQGDTTAPKANNRTRRARHYRNRKGATNPKDLIPNDLKLINWTDDNGNEVFTRRTLSLTLGQVRSVSGQLGYMPLNIVSIGAINMKPKMQESPLVAILYPLTMDKLTRQGRSHLLKNQNESKERGKCGWEPFPTTCWLTCPLLHAQICKLEDAGWIQKFEERLQSSDEHLRSMEEAHRAYAGFRWDLLQKADKDLVQQMGWMNMLKYDVGIAGIRAFNTVKCLHCHYAHYLARPQDNNIVGSWVAELLEFVGFHGGASFDTMRQLGGNGSPSRVYPQGARFRQETKSFDEEVDPSEKDEDTTGKKQHETKEYEDEDDIQSDQDFPVVIASLSEDVLEGLDAEEASSHPETPECDTSPSEIMSDMYSEVSQAYEEESPYGSRWTSMLSDARSEKHRSRIPTDSNNGATPEGSQQCTLGDCICT